MNKCRGLFGVHDFQARYSLGAAQPFSDAVMTEIIDAFSDYGIEGIVRATKSKTYCGDVCVRCGAVANGPLKEEGARDE